MLSTSETLTFLKDRISPEAQREGQELVHTGKVEITKLTSQLVGGIAEGTRIQIHFTPEKVHITKECSCQTKHCPHIPALLQLWNESNEQAFSNKAGYWRKVISDIPEDGKNAFILDQVKRSKATAYDLRAYILRQQGLYAPSMAKAIFDEIKSPVVRSTKTPTAPQVRLFGQMTKTTLKSADDLVKAGYVFQGIAVLMYLLESLHYLYFRLLRNNSTILKHIVQVEKMFTDLFPLIRAPEAQYDILESWKSLTAKSYYVPISVEQIVSFYQALNTVETRQNIMEHVEGLLKKSTDFSLSIWTDIWLQMLLFDPKVKTTLTIHDLPEHKEEMIWQTLSDHPLPENFLTIFNQMLGKLAQKHVPTAMNILLREKMIEKVLTLMEQHPELKLPSTNDKLAIQIFKKITSKTNINLIQKTSILAQTEQTDTLIKFIHKENHLQATILLLPHLPKQEIENLHDIILQQLNEYLQTHIGEKSEKLVDQLIQILERKRNKTLLKTIKSTLKESFGYRNDVHNVLSTQ